MKTTILSSLIFLGVCLLIVSYFEGIDSSMRMWLVLVAMATEGLLARYLVQDQKIEAPGRPFWEKILPATVPLVILVFGLKRIFELYRAPFF